MRPKNLAPSLRKAEEEYEIDLDPEQLAIITQKDCNVSHARGESLLELIANRETLIHRACEQATWALLWMEIALHLYAENTQNQDILQTQDYQQFLSIM